MNENQLLVRIEQLEEEIRRLKSFTSIPFDVEGAFKQRLNIDARPIVTVSTKTSTSEDHGAMASGLASPDGFLQMTINNTLYYFPYYS